MTPEEILAKHSKNYGAIEGNPRAIVKASEAIDAIKEYAKLLLEEYTNRIVENAFAESSSSNFNSRNGLICVHLGKVSVNKESITSQLPKFLKEKGYE